jgi:hypothetical protein
MADTITYFGEPTRAIFPNGQSIVVNGRPLLIPENFDLQNEINAAHYAATRPEGPSSWIEAHYSHGSAGDPQRQAGNSGGFDPRYTDAGNYGFGLGKAAAGHGVNFAIGQAKVFNSLFGSGKALPKANESAIRQAYQDYQDGKFLKPDAAKGKIYVDATEARDKENFRKLGSSTPSPSPTPTPTTSPTPERTDVQRYALEKWGNLDSPEAKAFMANFEQAFGSYPQHVDLDKLHPLPADGSIPPGKDVSLFVGRNGEVLYYERDPAPGNAGALRGIYGLDGSPGDTTSLPGVAGLDRRPKGGGLLGLLGMGNGSPGLAPAGSGSTGMMFFGDGTPRPDSIRPHPATPGDPTGGVDVTLKDGSKEHWWNDQIDGFIRSKISPFDDGAPAVPFAPPAGVVPNPVQPGASPRPGDATQGDPRNVRVLSRIPAPGATPPVPDNANKSQPAAGPRGPVSGRPMPDHPVPPWLFGLPDRSAPSGDDMDDWYTRWIKPLVRP